MIKINIKINNVILKMAMLNVLIFINVCYVNKILINAIIYFNFYLAIHFMKNKSVKYL